MSSTLWDIRDGLDVKLSYSGTGADKSSDVTAFNVHYGVGDVSAMVEVSVGSTPKFDGGGLPDPSYITVSPGKPIKIILNGVTVFTGYPAGYGRALSHHSASNQVDCIGRLAEVAEFGVLRDAVYGAVSTDHQQKGEATGEETATHLPSFGPRYEHGKNIADWLVDLMNYAQGSESIVLPVVADKSITAKHDFSASLNTAVVSLASRAARSDASWLQLLMSLCQQLDFILVPKMNGTYGIRPNNPMAKKSVWDIKRTDVLGQSLNIRKTVYPSLRVWVPRVGTNYENAAAAGAGDFSTLQATTGLYWIYPEPSPSSQDGKGKLSAIGGATPPQTPAGDPTEYMNRMVHRPPLFGWVIGDDKNEDALGKAYAQTVWAATAIANLSGGLLLPHTFFNKAVDSLGSVISLESSVRGSSLFAYLTGVSLNVHPAADQGAKISMQLELSHIRGEGDNQDFGLDEHPIYKI